MNIWKFCILHFLLLQFSWFVEASPVGKKSQRADLSNWSDTTFETTLGKIMRANLFEDDEIYDDFELNTANQNARKRRLALYDKLWPKTGKFVYIPYVVAEGTPYIVEEAFLNGVKRFDQSTCIRFRERTHEEHFLTIQTGNNGCWSHVGYRPGVTQKLSLDSSPVKRCLDKDIVLHEMMHVLSIEHMVKRQDSDKYVKIIKENLREGNLFQFEKHQYAEGVVSGLPFDLNSVMMYGPFDLSKDEPSSRTIEVRGEPDRVDFGGKEDWSTNDVIEINRLYECIDYLDIQ